MVNGKINDALHVVKHYQLWSAQRCVQVKSFLKICSCSFSSQYAAPDTPLQLGTYYNPELIPNHHSSRRMSSSICSAASPACISTPQTIKQIFEIRYEVSAALSGSCSSVYWTNIVFHVYTDIYNMQFSFNAFSDKIQLPERSWKICREGWNMGKIQVNKWSSVIYYKFLQFWRHDQHEVIHMVFIAL